MFPNKSTRSLLFRKGDGVMANWNRPDGKLVWALCLQKDEELSRMTIMGKYKDYNVCKPSF